MHVVYVCTSLNLYVSLSLSIVFLPAIVYNTHFTVRTYRTPVLYATCEPSFNPIILTTSNPPSTKKLTKESTKKQIGWHTTTPTIPPQT